MEKLLGIPKWGVKNSQNFHGDYIKMEKLLGIPKWGVQKFSNFSNYESHNFASS
jgi:hypothetical protein